MTRKIDGLGRVVLPVEFRQALGINEGDDVEVALGNNEIVLKRAAAGCVFCSADADLIENDGIYVCRLCVERLQSLAKSLLGDYSKQWHNA